MSVALWLLPAEPAGEELRAEIGRLSRLYSSPCFEPHLTLLHPVPAEHVEERMQALVPHCRGLDLDVEGISAGEDFYRCVFVTIAMTARLAELRREAETLFSVAPLPFHPHVSLVYADLLGAERAKIARGAGFSRRTISVAALEAVDVSGAVDEWRVVGRARV